VLALTGKNKVQEATPPVPERAIDSTKADVQVAKGDGEKFVRKPKRQDDDRPIYSKWWFWTGVGVVAVAGGVGIYAATSGGGTPPPTTDLGNISFGK